MGDEAATVIDRRTGLRLDRDGRLWHDGGLVEHPRLLAALRSGLGRDPSGRPIVRLGTQWGWLEVEETLFRVTAVELSSAQAEPDRLESATFWRDDGHQWHAAGPDLRLQLCEDGALQVACPRDGEWCRAVAGVHASLGRFLEPTTAGGWALRTIAGLVEVERSR